MLITVAHPMRPAAKVRSGHGHGCQELRSMRARVGWRVHIAFVNNARLVYLQPSSPLQAEADLRSPVEHQVANPPSWPGFHAPWVHPAEGESGYEGTALDLRKDYEVILFPGRDLQGHNIMSL